MTTGNGNNGSSRLDRIEEILAQTAIQTAANTQAIASNAQAIASNARAIEANSHENTLMREAIISLVETSEAIIERLDTQGEEIREIASQVRGLQTENRRILEILERGEGRQE